MAPLEVPDRSKSAKTSAARLDKPRAAERDHLAQRGWDTRADRLDQLDLPRAGGGAVAFAVGFNHASVDPSGSLDLDVLVGGEQSSQPCVPLVGEQFGCGVQGAAGGLERVAGAAAVAVDGLLDPSSALVKGVAGEAQHMEGGHHRDGVGEVFDGGGLEPT